VDETRAGSWSELHAQLFGLGAWLARYYLPHPG
jgi:hypothetical protein